MVPFVKEILDCRHLTFLPYILIFGIFLPNPQILLHTSWKMSRYSFHPGFCKTYCTPLPPTPYLLHIWRGLQLKKQHSGERINFNFKTIWYFLLRLMLLISWWLGRCWGGISSWSCRDIRRRFLALLCHLWPLLWFSYFFFEESRSYNVCLVVLFSGSLRLVESLATAHRSLHLHRGNYCLPGKIREFLALRSLLRFGKRLLLFSRIASVPTAYWF